MNKTERKAIIENRISAFSKDEYNQQELFNEMLKLQSEFAEITFDGENPDAKIQEIRKHYKQLNIEKGNIANAEFERFSHSSYGLQNSIMCLLSGKKGEDFTEKTLRRLRRRHEIIRNVELDSDGKRTELDYVVVTNKAIFILEIKNASNDITIDSKGNFIRDGRHMHLECNIYEKMRIREEMLRELLNNAGIYNLNIQSYLVFTNNRITISNYCKDIRVSFLNQLPYLIDRYDGWMLYSPNRIVAIKNAIEAARVGHTYPVNEEIIRVKEDFVNLILALENDELNNKKHNIFSTILAWIIPRTRNVA